MARFSQAPETTCSQGKDASGLPPGVRDGTAGGLWVDEKLIIEYKIKINKWGYTTDQNRNCDIACDSLYLHICIISKTSIPPK